MNKRIFISYSHKQGNWVFNKLVPCLRAGGANIVVDRERFEAGKALLGQMDAIHDASDLTLLILTPDYLASSYCLHEMHRAIARDPGFRNGLTIPVLYIDCPLPIEFKKALFVDLRDDQNANQWDLLLSACNADIGTSVPDWLRARDEIVRYLNQGESVNLVVSARPRWRELIDNIRGDFLPSLGVVDLESGSTASQRGFIKDLLKACGLNVSVPPEPMDIVTLSRIIGERNTPVLLAMMHFDLVASRKWFLIDFFAALRDLIIERKKLILLVQSRVPWINLLPSGHSLSSIISNITTIELKGYDTFSLKQGEGGQRLQVISLALDASNVSELKNLDTIVAQLPEGKTGFLAQTPSLRIMVNEITKLQIRLDTVNRPILREPIANLLYKEIENFQHKIIGFYEPISTEFYKAANHWLRIAQKQLDQAQVILSKEPSPVVFRAGDPVNREQEAFVPRYGVVGDLDKQIMLSTGCPGLVLYGRRRMGKSTVLHNLNGFLPDSVIPVVISMQDPQAFTSLADLLHLIAQKLAPSLGGETGNDINLNRFMQLLAQSNEKLKAAGKRVLLAIDEYENIDRKLGEKIFPEDLLVTVRESIQTHRHITWIFVGSHDITELQHAEWPSYLVSARTIEVPLFTPAETRLLLTEPMKFSPLWPKDDPKRPRFAPEFWGENGIERIQREAGGWPHLVQLIAETIVDLINDETKRQVDAELFERSLNKAIVSGHNVLYQLMRGESTLPGEWEYLSAFRKRETQSPPDNEAIYTSLRRRLLVEEENGEWRLRVPLMARWLKERG